jgi:hypothetical protein
MKPVILNILAVIAGFLGGSLINMGLIQTGHSLFPIKGVNPEDMEALAAAIPTLEFKYFIFPFLAHALGTLAGAFIAGFIAKSHKLKFALGVGVLFLLGGIMASFMLPAPVWFIGTDLALAYIPMAWIGGRAALKVTAMK